MPALESAIQRDFAVEVVRRLHAAGHEAYWAGGCVRDRLMGHEPKDYDVATSARPEQVRDLFGHRRTLAIGAAFGVICVLGPPHAGQVEATTFRTDAAYSDGRRPDAVHFSTAEEDAQRRDFTINGLFYDPLHDRLLDYVGGVEDLQRQVIRAIRNPHERFQEDKLRMLRAVRFAATFQFALEQETFVAVKAMAGEVTVVSVERIAEELRRMLEHRHRAVAAGLLRESGLLAAILPEAIPLAQLPSPLHTTATDAWDYTLQVLAALESPDFPLALAALLHGLGNSGDLAHTIGRRLKLAVKEIERTAWLLENMYALEQAKDVPWPRLQRLLIHEGALDLIHFHLARAEAGAAKRTDADHCRELLQLPPEQLDPPPLLTGDDLILHGIPRGKEYKTLLDAIRDAQLEEAIHTREEALKLIDVLRGKA